MADTILFNESIFQTWISELEGSLEYDLSYMEVSSKETLSAVRMMQESMSAYVEVLRMLSDNLAEEIIQMKAAADTIIETDQKARGSFSGKI
ncbi:MAG: hypothetical protein J5589_08900 [Firmicutes bacterium]|nr:hypothetical protein [Bacillota bacterium]